MCISFNKINLFFLISICVIIPSKISASPENIVNNFQTFSEELLALSADSEEATDTRPGLKLYNPFGIGYLLANINAQLWNVSTKGIPDALRTNENYVAEDYGYLLGLFKKSKFKITSTVYSRYGNVTKSPSLSKLLTHLIALDFVQKPAEFVDSFSSLLDLATKGHLDNELLPKALWDKIFDNSTLGVYVNTMHYKTKWSKPWLDIGDRSFNNDSIVKYLEIDGEFPVLYLSTMTAVIVEIQQVPLQQIVFIKPHIHFPMDHLRHEIRKLLATNSSWPLMQLRVQIPAVNVTNLSRHNLGFSLMGMNETFCQMSNGTFRDVVQQPIAQASHFEFASTYIEFASGTGSSVNLLQDQVTDTGFEEEYEDEYPTTKDGNDPAEELEEGDPISLQKSLRRKYQRIMKDVSNSDGKCEKPDEFSKSHRISQSGIHDADGKDTLIFDTPFTFFLRDNTLGEATEAFAGSVSSLCQYRKIMNAIQTNSGHAWLHDVFKVAFWKCV